MEKLSKILDDLNISGYKKEAYLALLKIRQGTIQQIAKNSNVPSPKLYETLRWLHQNGFITLIVEKPLKYAASDPKFVLEDEINKNKAHLDDIKDRLGLIGNDFFEPDQNSIEIVNSKNGLRKKIKEYLDKSKYSVSYIVNTWSQDSEIFRTSKKKSLQGVNIRALGPINKDNKNIVRLSKDSGIKIKEFHPKTTRFSIFDKQVVIIKLRKKEDDNMSIIIKSDVLGEILENYFDSLWRGKISS